jgi:hypothetical protein
MHAQLTVQASGRNTSCFVPVVTSCTDRVTILALPRRSQMHNIEYCGIASNCADAPQSTLCVRLMFSHAETSISSPNAFVFANGQQQQGVKPIVRRSRSEGVSHTNRTRYGISQTHRTVYACQCCCSGAKRQSAQQDNMHRNFMSLGVVALHAVPLCTGCSQIVCTATAGCTRMKSVSTMHVLQRPLAMAHRSAIQPAWCFRTGMPPRVCF